MDISFEGTIQGTLDLGGDYIPWNAKLPVYVFFWRENAWFQLDSQNVLVSKKIV